MGKRAEDSVLEAINVELGIALSDLAQSVDLAIKRMALRTELSATIADAGKVLDAATTLRGAAAEIHDRVPLVPGAEQAEIAQNVSNARTAKWMSKVEEACVTLAANG
jgi:hypothetical protein